MTQIRNHISEADKKISELRQEILADIDIMLSKKKQYIFDGDQPLASHNGVSFAIDSIHGENKEENIECVEVSGVDNNGGRFVAPMDELDTDVILQIADIMCEQYENL